MQVASQRITTIFEHLLDELGSESSTDRIPQVMP
jgi:hypothetical protein